MVPVANAMLGIHIDSNTAATRWRGERMDYGLAVGILCDQELRSRGEDHALPEEGEHEEAVEYEDGR